VYSVYTVKIPWETHAEGIWKITLQSPRLWSNNYLSKILSHRVQWVSLLSGRHKDRKKTISLITFAWLSAQITSDAPRSSSCSSWTAQQHTQVLSEAGTATSTETEEDGDS